MTSPEKRSSQSPTIIVPQLTPGQISYHEHDEVLRGLSPFVAKKNQELLLPIDKIWQPSRFIPNPTTDEGKDKLQSLQTEAQRLPDAYWVVLVGDTVTEEALPSYMTWLNRIAAISDQTGADQTPWATWIRGWTAEEDRHKRALDRYLTMTGRVNMDAVDKTIHHLIANGFNPQIKLPLEAFAYTSFQERGTDKSHATTAVQAREFGAPLLGQICGSIAGDEKRHERFYKEVMQEAFSQHPDAALISFRNVMKAQVVMPAAMMDDQGKMARGEKQSKLFTDYSNVAHSTGVYTATDYVNIFGHFMQYWDVEHQKPVSSEGKKAQEQLGKLYRIAEARFADAMDHQVKQAEDPRFSWIDNRVVHLKRAA